MGSFQPKMTARRDGITVLGDRRAHLSAHGLAEVWRARCVAGATGEYVSLDPRLFIVLDPLDAAIELDIGAGEGASASRAPSVSYLPAGAALKLSVTGETEIQHLDIHFEAKSLDGIEGAQGGLPAEPRLHYPDERVQRLGRLLAAVCTGPTPSSGHYGDGLIAALLAAALRPRIEPGRRTALSDRQLKLAVDMIEARCAERIRLQDLAELTGLSESYFSHAFKAATGMPPHRWQLSARVRRAQDMLARSDAPLIEIAVATGFADQPHFTRVFRTLTGRTPLSWRAEMR